MASEHKLKKTELWVTIAGMVAVVATSTLQSGVLAPVPHVAAVLGIVAAAASYVAGRSWVKGKHAEAAGALISRKVNRPNGDAP